jgi:hypothetical protein
MSPMTLNWINVLDSNIKLSTDVLHDIKLHRWGLEASVVGGYDT